MFEKIIEYSEIFQIAYEIPPTCRNILDVYYVLRYIDYGPQECEEDTKKNIPKNKRYLNLCRSHINLYKHQITVYSNVFCYYCKKQSVSVRPSKLKVKCRGRHEFYDTHEPPYFFPSMRMVLAVGGTYHLQELGNFDLSNDHQVKPTKTIVNSGHFLDTRSTITLVFGHLIITFK